ncbi:tetratricopeptide repeat protein [Membranihabitans marinus]|uniref:tetratricopeptide repeat protein n=1 Tax=Membranihabitans marinus TaxID=1227546 RepID=UPI001F4764DA|nr:hypothetical protein [Membranihabitans marinus]
MSKEKDKLEGGTMNRDSNSETDINKELTTNSKPSKINLNKKWRSQDLVREAYNETAEKGKILVKKALKLYPNNVDAYSYLASIEDDISKAIMLYKKAIQVGEIDLGKEMFIEDRGYFWGYVETRPYMRAKADLADCYYSIGEDEKAIAIYEEMLELNTMDNQGVRYMLSNLLLALDDLSKYESFTENMEDENCAVLNFNKALYGFKKWGNTLETKKWLSEANKNNPYVIDYLLGAKKMPDSPPLYIGIGDENEAIAYVNDAYEVWDETDGSFKWLIDFKKNRLRKKK